MELELKEFKEIIIEKIKDADDFKEIWTIADMARTICYEENLKLDKY